MTATTASSAPRAGGLVIALVSAFAFALSGPLAKPLMDSGWAAGSAVLVRIGVSALVMLIPTVVIVARSRGQVLRANWRFLVGYGLFPIAGAQLGFFSAIRTLPVGVALLIEYLAPVLVVVWLWLRRGQAPTWLTVAGAATSMVGLVLVLNLTGDTVLDPTGVAWALFASACLCVYFILSATVVEDLSPVVVIGSGFIVGFFALAGLGLVGLLPMSFLADDGQLNGVILPWWAFAGMLVVVATVFAYLTGIAAARRLGPRLASFVALAEVVFAATVSWLVLDQVPTVLQLLGGILIIGGVVLVRLGERPIDVIVDSTRPEPSDQAAV